MARWGPNRLVDRMGRLVDDLLDASRIATGRLKLERDKVELVGLVAGVAEQMREALLQAGCPLQIITRGPVEGMWDRLRIEQVLVNLLTNASKYAPGDSVVVEVRGGVETAVLEVRDHGPGIPQEIRARIFEPFVRSAAKGVQSFGLGLHITRHIVQAHGGTIAVESRPGEGTTFTVTLPLTSPEERTSREHGS